MGRYEDDAKLELIGLAGLLVTLLLIILFDKC